MPNQSIGIQREHVHSSPFSNEAIAFAAEARHWITRRKLLVIMGTTAIALSLCWLGSMIVYEIANNYILDIHQGPFPGSIYIGSYSSCQPDERFPGGPPVIEDHGGITVMMTPWGPQVYHHASEERFCEQSNLR